MTQEQKQLLVKDLSARLPYGVRIAKANVIYPMTGVNIALGYVELAVSERISIEEARPYLRPMSSMTEEEIYELRGICDENDLREECGDIVSTIYGMTVLHGEVEDVYPYNLKIKISQNLNYAVLDYLNAHHFDYRELIEKGLALTAPDGMYDTESKSGSHKYFPSEFGSYEEYAEYLKKNSYALDAPEKGIILND